MASNAARAPAREIEPAWSHEDRSISVQRRFSRWAWTPSSRLSCHWEERRWGVRGVAIAPSGFDSDQSCPHGYGGRTLDWRTTTVGAPRSGYCSWGLRGRLEVSPGSSTAGDPEVLGWSASIARQRLISGLRSRIRNRLYSGFIVPLLELGGCGVRIKPYHVLFAMRGAGRIRTVASCPCLRGLGSGR
jgi:hypothetical protein